MTFDELRQSIERDAAPPATLGPAVRALWHAAGAQNASGWENAHRLVQDDPGQEAAWVHAYLHRKEGDIGNAGYWYSRAGKKMPAAGVTLETEWADIARALLGR